MRTSWGTVGVAALLAIAIPSAAQASQEPGPLQKSLNDLELKGDWVYSDLAEGFAQAQSTGKPLLIVFR